MSLHPAMSHGRVAVITGGASGIGLAAAKRFAALGMKLVLADLRQEALDHAAAELNGATIVTVPTDVSKMEDVQHLKERAYAEFGEVAVLMNNAGTSPGGGPWDHYERWQRVIGVNLWGVINGVHAFTEPMIGQGTPCAIVNTGSKQGITCPLGDAAYNVTKAGVKVLTEGLAHALRNVAGCEVTAHLLVPGSTFTGLTARGRTEKPPGAWTPDRLHPLRPAARSAADRGGLLWSGMRSSS
jgi:NAD(P)-dependent dehydrogenase (short-subunit alcohol dehydrogenase family)